jgi:NAD(P)-dependent dehydrogenase (short-subunit alcohol dehydrogenase family)
MKDLAGMKIIVTGGAGSIGHATAEVLAAKGADILLVDINREGLERRRAAVATFGTQVETFHADVSRSDAVQGYVGAACKAFGRIDGLFNNAGTEGKLASIETYDEAEFDRLMAINLRSIFLGMRHVIPVMLKQGGGAVVNTGSIASERGLAGACAYNATKHGVIGLTRTAAADVGARGVRVNAVMPGVIDTPLLEAMLKTLFNGDIELGKRTRSRFCCRPRRASSMVRRGPWTAAHCVPSATDAALCGKRHACLNGPLPMAAGGAAECEFRRGVLRSQCLQLSHLVHPAGSASQQLPDRQDCCGVFLQLGDCRAANGQSRGPVRAPQADVGGGHRRILAGVGVVGFCVLIHRAARGPPADGHGGGRHHADHPDPDRGGSAA